MVGEKVTIRKAVAADGRAIARVHVESTLSTYRGIMPDDYLDSIDVKERENRWRDILADSDDARFTYVCEERGQIVGFAAGGPERIGDSAHDGELYAIYLLENHQRKGIGRRLTAAIAQRLLEAGMQSMLIWVLADNAPARRFYEALDGENVREQEITIGGANLIEVAYGWKDIRELAKTT